MNLYQGINQRLIALEKLASASRAMAIDMALQAVEQDPHQFGTRPCETCRVVTQLCGRPFGCVAALAKEKAKVTK